MSDPELGDKVKDIVTGYQGVVVCVGKYITGVTMFGVVKEYYPNNPEGNPNSIAWFDGRQLQIIQKQAVATMK